MKQLTKEFQGKEYCFDFCMKHDVKRNTPTVVVLLRKTDQENVFESFAIDIYKNPLSEFTLHPKLQEIQKADCALLLQYVNHQDSEQDRKILKALGDILYSNFKDDRIIKLDE